MKKTKKQENWKTRCKRLGKALPIETKREFMTAIRRGSKIGAAKDRVGITLDEAIGVLDNNILTKKVRYFREEKDLV